MTQHNTLSHVEYIRRETRVSMVINTALSAVFFAVAFGWYQAVPVWGAGNWVFDFIPQSFMIALMSTLVPGFITGRKVKAGTLVANGPTSALPQGLLVRSIVVALASALAGTAIVAALARLSGAIELSIMTAATLKIGYGALLARIITPAGLRAALAARTA